MQPEGEERPLSWLAVLSDTPVYSSDDQQVGAVREVLGSQPEDIFHGIVVAHGVLGYDAMIPAGDISAMTNLRVTLTLQASQVRELPPYVRDER